MVFLNIPNLVRSRGPDEFWRKRRIFKLSAHFVGRRRNCYSIAVRNVHRALAYATYGRKLKKLEMAELWKSRVASAAEQYGLAGDTFQECLIRSNILLNKKSLADLAIWEPKSFESLVMICREKAIEWNFPGVRERSVMNQVYGLNRKDK